MRWFWIDRFVEFTRGQRAVALKNVTLAEDYLQGHFPGFPAMPPSLIIEGMAQTGGTLVGEATQYQSRLVLAKVSQARFYFPARPGDTLRYTARIHNQSRDGALLRTTSHVGETLQAEAEIYLAILGERHAGVVLFEPADFARLLRILRVYEVARDVDGTPLAVPEHLLALEREKQS